MRQLDLSGRMRVGIDRHHASELQRASVPSPIKIEPPRVGIDLHCDAMPGAGF